MQKGFSFGGENLLLGAVELPRVTVAVAVGEAPLQLLLRQRV